METISKSIKKTSHAIIVEECMKTGGIGASLSAIINESLFDELDHQVCFLLLYKSAPQAAITLRMPCYCRFEAGDGSQCLRLNT